MNDITRRGGRRAEEGRESPSLQSETCWLHLEGGLCLQCLPAVWASGHVACAWRHCGVSRDHAPACLPSAQRPTVPQPWALQPGQVRRCQELLEGGRTPAARPRRPGGSHGQVTQRAPDRAVSPGSPEPVVPEVPDSELYSVRPVGAPGAQHPPHRRAAQPRPPQVPAGGLRGLEAPRPARGDRPGAKPLLRLGGLHEKGAVSCPEPRTDLEPDDHQDRPSRASGEPLGIPRTARPPRKPPRRPGAPGLLHPEDSAEGSQPVSQGKRQVRRAIVVRGLRQQGRQMEPGAPALCFQAPEQKWSGCFLRAQARASEAERRPLEPQCL
ncbi:translation initiation factor IF-2 [Macaca nemestrina]|uniref:translation initiation factor IF-2 n=1 Tax=Macaca nemestrina TaxID=9545 RepID=UPI0039B8C31B